MLRTFLCALFVANLSCLYDSADLAQDETELGERWQNPPLEFRLNKNLHQFPLDKTQQQQLIENRLAEGWGGFAINSPFNHYLTEKGMLATRTFCELAQQSEMDLWLYDEEGYPSGSAGGRVTKEHPQWQAMGLFFTDFDVSEGPVELTLPPGSLLQALAFPSKLGDIDFNDPTDLSSLVDDGQLKWDAPSGTWKVFTATTHTVYEGFQADRNAYHHPSPMVGDATDAFLNSTHEIYADYLGNDLGRFFTATFTDEPSSMAMPFHAYTRRHAVIPWHPILSTTFQDQFNYELETKLVELFYDEGPNGQLVRCQYFQTVADLIATNYFSRIKNWCESHNLQSGGHLLLEESMIAHAPLYGDIMKCFREMHAPGIDILSCYPENLPVHSPKLASSAAELMGRTRVMSEPCPVADKPTEPPVESIRGFFNILMVGGITDFNCYLKLETATAEQKREINEYVGRVNMMLRGGITQAEVGVVYPIESLWANYRPRYQKVVGWQHVSGATEKVNQIDQSFKQLSRLLFDQRWEYLHLDSKAISDSKAQNGTLQLTNHRFKVIILPQVSTLPTESWNRLAEFAGQGGTVLLLGQTPQNSTDRFPHPQVQRDFEVAIKTLPNVVFLPDWTNEQVLLELDKSLARPFEIADPQLPLRLAHKRKDGHDVYFLINDSNTEHTTTINFPHSKEVEEWDPASKSIQRFTESAKINLPAYHGKVYRTKYSQE